MSKFKMLLAITAMAVFTLSNTLEAKITRIVRSAGSTNEVIYDLNTDPQIEYVYIDSNGTARLELVQGRDRLIVGDPIEIEDPENYNYVRQEPGMMDGSFYKIINHIVFTIDDKKDFDFFGKQIQGTILKVDKDGKLVNPSK